MPSNKFLKMIMRLVGTPFLKFTVFIFFNKKYLQGRHFDHCLAGWVWGWRSLFTQKILGYNRHISFPVSPFITISSPNNIIFDPDDLNIFQDFGNYFQCPEAKIYRERKGTYIAS